MGFFQKLRLFNKKHLTVKFIELPLKIDFFIKKELSTGIYHHLKALCITILL